CARSWDDYYYAMDFW
nr:immunoglobulin heavy chain junction region [Mus musculus]